MPEFVKSRPFHGGGVLNAGAQRPTIRRSGGILARPAGMEAISLIHG